MGGIRLSTRNGIHTAARGLVPLGTLRHTYLEGPPQHKDPSKFITQVILPIAPRPEDLAEDWPWTSVRFLSAPDDTTLAVWRLERDGLRLLIDAGSGLPVYGCVGVADSGPYVEDAWWVTAEVLRMLYTDAIPGVQGDDLTTELQSSDEKAVFSAAGTLTTPYTLRMQTPDVSITIWGN